MANIRQSGARIREPLGAGGLYFVCAVAIGPIYPKRSHRSRDEEQAETGPLFRPLKHNGKQREERRRMDPDAIDRVVRKYAGKRGLDRGYSAHSMRATFITTALENGAQLEDVQKAAGHRDPSTTKLYDRRGYNPEKAASFFATY
jgi:integrase/recombinase XerD